MIFTKYFAFIDQLPRGAHDLGSDVFKVALTNTAPVPATQTTWNVTDAPPPSATNGYPAGGATITTASAVTTAGVFKLVFQDVQFVATGALGPARYAIVYNSSKANKLVGFIDYGVSWLLAETETVLVDFDGASGVLTLG